MIRVYKGIPTRDSTRESKMQMQECTTRRLCQQTEIMLGSEGGVMMLSMNLSTLLLSSSGTIFSSVSSTEVVRAVNDDKGAGDMTPGR